MMRGSSFGCSGDSPQQFPPPPYGDSHVQGYGGPMQGPAFPQPAQGNFNPCGMGGPPVSDPNIQAYGGVSNFNPCGMGGPPVSDTNTQAYGGVAQHGCGPLLWGITRE